jgi:hypothetical protein
MPSYKATALKLGNNWIGGIVSAAFTNATQMQTEPTAGSIYPLQTSIQEIKTGFRFTSHNVAAALGVLGFLGIPLSAQVPAELHEILYGDDGFIVAGNSHRKVAFTTGRAIWRTISCSNRQDAQIEIEVFGLSPEGSTNPATFSEGVAAPAAFDDARHTIASAQLAGIAMGCVTDIRLESGLTINSEGCKSDIFDTRMGVGSIVPKIQVTTLAANLVGAGAGKINLPGLAATHANTSIRFRKRVNKTGTFLADATAEHIVITSDGMVVPIQPFQAQTNADGNSQFELTAVFDGTNTPFLINAASAL